MRQIDKAAGNQKDQAVCCCATPCTQEEVGQVEFSGNKPTCPMQVPSFSALLEAAIGKKCGQVCSSTVLAKNVTVQVLLKAKTMFTSTTLFNS